MTTERARGTEFLLVQGGRTLRERQVVTAFAVFAVLTTLVIAGGTSPAGAAKNTASVTLSGAVSGKNSGGTLVCIESTQTKGPQLSFTLGSFMVGGKQYVTISAGGGKSGRPAGGKIVAFALPD